MFCTSCGIKNAADSNFCKQCGAKLDKITAVKISEAAFDRALPDDEQVVALLERAYRQRKEGDLDGAIVLCDEALHLRADSTSCHSLLGQLYEEKGDRASAIRAYERVLELNPGSIADRVKLDELRNAENPLAGGERKPLPRINMADHQSAPVFDYTRFVSAGVAIALVALGGLIALQMRPHSAGTPPNSTPLVAATNPAPAHPETALSKLPETSGTLAASAASSQTSTVNADRPLAGIAGASSPPAVAATNSALAANTASTPTTVIERLGPSRIQYVYLPRPSAARETNDVAAVHLPGRNGRANSRAMGAVPNADSDNGHVRLDPDVIESGNGKITVKVNENDVPSRSGEKPEKNSGKNADNSGGTPAPDTYTAVIKMARPSDTARPQPAAPSGDARSQIAIGETKKRARDFRGAIEAFTQALGSAGDQAGYVLQQSAICYQNLNDSASAKASYTRAIDEYRKLETRDPETASNGIRACQSGIRACGN